MQLGVQFCIHGEKNILGGVCTSRAGGRFSASFLVGLWGNHSDSIRRVVGSLPQRLVLIMRGRWARQVIGSRGLIASLDKPPPNIIVYPQARHNG